MKLEFDLENVTVTEFGVGRDEGDARTFAAVPVDADVQAALREMVQATWEALQNEEDGPVRYEPSEKHGSTEYCYVPLADEMASALRELHEATNLRSDAEALADPTNVFCYFVRLTDKENRRLTALRRASQFKGVLKKRLIQFVSDTLKLIRDDVFKLDTDFDLLVDDDRVHILRPSGFEFVGKLQQAILGAVPENIEAIRKELPFVDFTGIEAYAAKHTRAARYLASIRTQKSTKDIDKSLLEKACKQAGVEVSDSNGKLTIAVGHEMGFLELLDRRRYELELVKGQPERFKAAKRTRLNG